MVKCGMLATVGLLVVGSLATDFRATWQRRVLCYRLQVWRGICIGVVIHCDNTILVHFMLTSEFVVIISGIIR